MMLIMWSEVVAFIISISSKLLILFGPFSYSLSHSIFHRSHLTIRERTSALQSMELWEGELQFFFSLFRCSASSFTSQNPLLFLKSSRSCFPFHFCYLSLSSLVKTSRLKFEIDLNTLTAIYFIV